ncbi:MAG: sensor domain-containing diguanylate cyclase [Armatimonadetes bacterium]|nr:sensor domain-containing diguanylate cyclase [Armatimonadota bacterium]
MQLHSLKSVDLARLIDSRWGPPLPQEPSLDEVFGEILHIANEFVPSEAGSIMLEDREQMVFIASFGEQAEQLVGTRMPAGQGISGQVYLTGQPCVHNDVRQDERFYSAIDEMTGYCTRSILCVPVLVHDRVAGVLSLLNRKENQQFETRDLELMRVFSGYVATIVRNVLDARWQRELARRDHLTGLANDRYFFERLLLELERSERNGTDLGLIFLDLDHFKSVVDTYGHLVGSRVLADVGAVFRDAVAEPAGILGRYGGDEYVAILPGKTCDDLLVIGERVRKEIEEATFLSRPAPDGSAPLNLKQAVTASVGVASYRECMPDGSSLEARRNTFIRWADEAMYAAKAAGKNRVLSSRCLARAGIQLGSALHKGLQQSGREK